MQKIHAVEFFYKIQHTFITKTLSKLRNKRKFSQLIKDINAKPIINIVVIERLNIFPLSSRTRQGCPLSPLTFQHYTRVPAMQ